MIKPIELYTVYPIIYILLVFIPFISLFSLLFLFSFPFWDFVGISSANPHETSLVHLGELSGLKGLLHTAATVIPTTVS